MTIRPIVRYPDPRLALPAQPVTVFDDALRELATDLLETMHAAPGIGIARDLGPGEIIDAAEPGLRMDMRREMVVAGALAALAGSAAYAKDSPTSVKEAEQYLARGDLKAAEIALHTAIRDAPQDPVMRARLAEVYLQEGDLQSAEREARAARERNGNEADWSVPNFGAA